MVTTKIILDNRCKKPTGVYTVKLRVTFNSQQKYYLTGFKMSEMEFDNTMKDVPSKRYQDNKIELDAMLSKARAVIKKLVIFSFLGFEKKFLEADGKGQPDIFSLYQQIIDENTGSGKIGTASNYRCSLNSIKLFNDRLSYVDVTPEFLHQYEKHLLGEGKSKTTVGIYLRPLRAILNIAIGESYLPKENYPFGRRRYIIPEGKNPKKALAKEDFEKIWDYQCADPASFEARSKDFFILSYLCQGINFKDLLLLRKDQVSENELHFVRQKSKDTGRSNPILVTVPLLDESKDILRKWSTEDDQNLYVFDFVKPEMTAQDIYKTVQQFVKITNKYMNQIKSSLGISNKVTTYVARHQFSKAIIEAGLSVEYLSECLGHKNIQTTQSYVQSFNFDHKLETAKRILPVFKK